jgi:phosphonate transport system substrate-binding protein
VLISISCINPNEAEPEVNFTDTTDVSLNQRDTVDEAVYIAIASMTSPRETMAYYQDLINYMSAKINRTIHVRQKKTYEEVNEMLRNSEVDFAFICSGAFAHEFSNRSIDILVAPVINGSRSYQAYIVANKDSDIDEFSDLHSRSFAFTDPLSTTGRLYPVKLIDQMGTTDEDFFAKTIFTYGHDISIQMVNKGVVDGASVHGLIFEYLRIHKPEAVKNIKIIDKSGSIGVPPIVVPAVMDQEKVEAYKSFFVNLHKDSIGKSILTNLNIDKYEITTLNNYTSVFQLKEYTDNVQWK